MRLPQIRTSRPAFILICAAFGGVTFAVAGAAQGFFSFSHWVSGIGILLLVLLFLPKIFVIDDES